jgi:general secretion pathway protein D
VLKRIMALSLAVCLSWGWVAASYAQEQTWTVNFKDTDIQEVIKFVADVTGKTMVVDPRVKGRVKVISSERMNREELYSFFRAILEVHDFTLVEVGDVVRIIPLKDARSSPLPVGDAGDVTEGFVTEVIQLSNIAAAKVLPVLRPLVPQHSHLAAYDPSNAIIISDTAANIARLRDLIERIDKAAIPETEIVELKYATAQDVVTTLTALDKSENQRDPNAQSLIADKRNNSILISGDELMRERYSSLIRRLDRPRPQTGNVRVLYLEYAQATEVAETLTKVVQNIAKLEPGDQKANVSATVEADEATNALLITASGDTLDSLLSVVDRLDIRRAQVLVEAIIVEMTDRSGRDLGIDWMFRNSEKGVLGSSVASGQTLGGVASGIFSDGDDALQNLALALGGITGQTLGLAGTGGGEDFLALLTALENDSKANILSTPSILTMDNHEAAMSVGQNVPFVTGSYSSNATGGSGTNPFQTIQREDVGISLTVTPHVNAGDSILLDLAQEVSSIDQSGTGGASDIITNQRKFETQLLAADGEIVVLGGLIEEDVQQGEQRVPLLGSIPLVGQLFRSNSSNLTKRNLMVFIRATIIRDDETLMGATGEKYQFIREQQLDQREKGAFRLPNSSLPVLPPLNAEDIDLPEDFSGPESGTNDGTSEEEDERE